MTITAIGQLLGDIISAYMGIDPARVVLNAETFDAPKDSALYVLIIHDPIGGEVIGINSSLNESTGMETMGRAAHERFAIEVISRGRAATDRYQEVLFAIKSIIATQLAESNGIRFFRGGDALDLSAIEGAGTLRRYRIPVIVSNVQTKTAAVPMIDKFPPAAVSGDTLEVEA